MIHDSGLLFLGHPVNDLIIMIRQMSPTNDTVTEYGAPWVPPALLGHRNSNWSISPLKMYRSRTVLIYTTAIFKHV